MSKASKTRTLKWRFCHIFLFLFNFGRDLIWRILSKGSYSSVHSSSNDASVFPLITAQRLLKNPTFGYGV